MSNISNRHRVVLISTGPIGPKGDTGNVGSIGPSGSSQPFTETSTGTWTTENNIIVSGSVTVKGHLLPAGPYTANTSSYDLGSPTTAWRDLYVSNGSIRMISGSDTATLSFTNGNFIVSGAAISSTDGFSGLVDDSTFNAFTSSIQTTVTAIQSLTSSIIELNNTTASLLTVIRYEADSGSFNDLIGAVLTLGQNNQTDLSEYITNNDIVVSQLQTDIITITNEYVSSSDLATATVLSSSFAFTSSYINPTFISASAAASGFGSGGVDTSNLVTLSTFNTFTSSINSALTDYALINGNNTFVGRQVISGSLNGNVSTVTEDTSSILDCREGNFFTLTLGSSTTTTIQLTNISPGQTVNLQIIMGGSNTINFHASIKQSAGATYTPSTGAGEVDILTFISFDGSDIYMSYVQNLV